MKRNTIKDITSIVKEEDKTMIKMGFLMVGMALIGAAALVGLAVILVHFGSNLK